MKRILVYGLAGWEPEKEAKVVLRAIRNLGFRSIFFCDRANSACQFADRVVENPTWSYELLKNIAIEEKVDLALLIVDFASPLVGRLNRELKLPGPTDAQYAAVSDKLAWSQLARAHDLAMPKEVLVRTVSDFTAWDWDGPIIVKPTKSTGNVSDQWFGYKTFASLSEFHLQLRDRGEVERFLELNQKGTRLGQYLVQQYLPYKLWGNLGLTFVGHELKINEMHERFFHPYPFQTHQYASLGPTPLTAQQQHHADRVCKILGEKVGFKNTGLNIDIIETPTGEIYSIDVNVRFGSTWTTFLPQRKISYMEEAIKAFLGLDYQWPPCKGAFLRHKIELPAGQIGSIEWPNVDGQTIRLEGTEHIKPGTVIESISGRHTFPAEALIVGDTKAACLHTYENLKNQIRVHYQ